PMRSAVNDGDGRDDPEYNAGGTYRVSLSRRRRGCSPVPRPGVTPTLHARLRACAPRRRHGAAPGDDWTRWISRQMSARAALLLVAAQAALIVALLMSRARRRHTEARNNAFLPALPDLMFVQTRDEGIYVDYNAKDESLLIVPPSQFLGRRMRDVLP